MTPLDRFIQRWRIRRAVACIPPGSRVIDVGAHRGELFLYLGGRLAAGFGVEPLLTEEVRGERWEVRAGFFPAVAPTDGGWDVITMLAVLEHIPTEEQAALGAACARLLRPGGRVIITVPSPAVDHILAALHRLRLIEGMSLEQHYGFQPADTLRVFAAPEFKLVCRETFQLGLNHLFVFERR